MNPIFLDLEIETRNTKSLVTERISLNVIEISTWRGGGGYKKIY